MKKLLHVTFTSLALLTIVTAFTLFTSCSKKSELSPVNINPVVYQNDNVTIKVDPKLELLMIALRLAEIEPFSFNYYGQDYSQFVDGVDNLFAKQKEHPFVKDLKSRYKNYKDSYRDIVAITQYISDDMTQMTIKQKEMPKELKTFWKGVNFKTFIAQFNDFANVSNFARIWILYEPHLKRQAIAEQEFMTYNKSITDWISEYFFAPDSKPEYEIFSTTLTASYNFSLAPTSKDGKTKIKEIRGAYWTKDIEWNNFQIALHISGGYIYSLLEKHWDILSEDIIRITKKIYEDNQITEKVTDYISLSTAVNLLAIVFSLDYDIAKNNEEISTAFRNGITTNFLFTDVDKLLSISEAYKSNRKAYPDFETFVVEYLPGALKEL
ncbi:DUF4932 domain-containing protein [Treponema bryantii]|uniref:DUF4932 domain-containing protein n=1 Tax=Treponema bryantii TaxID=163 RepID=UPI002B291CB5|nr:hypothetical protein TRBR_27050 [Treponema bryantii]